MKSGPFFLAAVVVLVLDQLTKLLVRSTLPLGHSVQVVDGVIRLTHVGNTGAVFGVFPGQGYIFLIMSLVLLGLILFVYRNPQMRRLTWGLGIIFGGGVGNLIDRLHQGYVTDFIDLRVWPVFNVADASIVLGTGFLVFMVLKGDRS